MSSSTGAEPELSNGSTCVHAAGGGGRVSTSRMSSGAQLHGGTSRGIGAEPKRGPSQSTHGLPNGQRRRCANSRSFHASAVLGLPGVSDNPVGANVQSDGYDFMRLSDCVAYPRNGTNLDPGSLPVPDETPPVP